MPLKDILLPEFDMEMDNTRRTLERVPDDKFGWAPRKVRHARVDGQPRG